MKTTTAARHTTRPIAVGSIPGIAIGTLAGVDDGRGALVEYPGCPAAGPLPALATVPFSQDDIGRSVALGFTGGDPLRPVLLGFLWQPAAEPEEGTEPAPESAVVSSDGERVVIEAEQEITLRCGRSSITLTRAGKILLRGAYLLSRSSGVNRIKGGSVQIN